MLAAIKRIYETPAYQKQKMTRAETIKRKQKEKDLHRDKILEICKDDFKSSIEIFNILDLSKGAINQHTLFLIKNNKLDFEYRRIDGTRNKFFKAK